MTHACTRSIRQSVCSVAVAVALTLAFASSAFAQADIQSTGPLTDITVGDDLTCEVTAYGFPQFFGGGIGEPGSCGWTLASGGTLYGYSSDGNDWASVNQATLSGAGTPSNPYVITTTVAATSNGNAIGIQLAERDTYVVGDESYRTDLTVQNTTGAPFSGTLYHVSDCTLQGDDDGFGFEDPTSGTVACAQNANNSPPGPLAAFVPLTPGSHYLEGDYGDVDFTVPNNQVDYASTCDCTNSDDNGMGVNWDIQSLPNGGTATFSLLTDISATGTIALPLTASGGQSLTGAAGTPLSATVASVSDPNSSDAPNNLSATINWGDGSTSAGAISGGNGSFAVAGTHTYASGGSYTITVTVTRAGNSATATDSAVITSTPTPGTTAAPTVGITAAGFSGSVVPGGLATTASFQYGLDPKYTGGGPIVYTNSTPAQTVGADFSSHSVSASVSGLVPNALYHVRLIASNSAGTTFGADTTFTTNPAPPPTQPTLGQTFNIAPVSGVVLVKINGVFVPLTQLRQIPQNVLINALHGTLQLITAAGGGPSGAHDAAAKHKPKIKTQKGSFGGAIFKLNQTKSGAGKGLVTLTLVESAFKGAPSYALCKKGGKKKAGDASAAAASSKVLQLLHASAKGKFKTTGKYSAATVRGTKWTIADRCDGTVTHDVTDSVAVTDFVRHKTIILHAGQSYLALASPKKHP